MQEVVFRPHPDELALPPRQRRGDEPGGAGRIRGVLNPVVARSQNPLLGHLELTRRPRPYRRVRVHLVAPSLRVEHHEATPQGETPVASALRRNPVEGALHPEETLIEPRAVLDPVPEHPAEAELEIRRRRELPERVHVAQVAGAGRFSKQSLVPAAGHLYRGLPSAEALHGKEPMDRHAVLCERPLTDEGQVRQRSRLERKRVRVPAVQLAKLLEEPAELDAEASGKVAPLQEAFLDLDAALFPLFILFVTRKNLEGSTPFFVREEDLGERKRIERGLDRQLELTRDEVVDGFTSVRDAPEQVPGQADLGVQRLE